MDDEKLEKTIEFILNNQAQFTVGIQKMQEAQKEGEKRVNVLERVCLNLYNASVEQKDAIAEQNQAIAEQTKNYQSIKRRCQRTARRAEGNRRAFECRNFNG